MYVKKKVKRLPTPSIHKENGGFLSDSAIGYKTEVINRRSTRGPTRIPNGPHVLSRTYSNLADLPNLVSPWKHRNTSFDAEEVSRKNCIAAVPSGGRLKTTRSSIRVRTLAPFALFGSLVDLHRLADHCEKANGCPAQGHQGRATAPNARSRTRGRCMASEGRIRLLPIPRSTRQYRPTAHLQKTRKPTVAQRSGSPQSMREEEEGATYPGLEKGDSTAPSSTPLSGATLLRRSSFVRAVCVDALARICAGGGLRRPSLPRPEPQAWIENRLPQQGAFVWKRDE